MNNTSLQIAIVRTLRFLEEIKHLKESEFPYAHSEEALDAIQDQFQNKLNSLRRITNKSLPMLVKRTCSIVLQDIKLNLPLLGFLLRSTNVRNAFEVHGPLLRLACQVLEPEIPTHKESIKLILSSEWNYSPFTFTDIPSLPGFVFIGSPAHEASNPLLIPLAGHELGHSLWIKKGFAKSFLPAFKEAIKETILVDWGNYIAAFDLAGASLNRTSFDLDDLRVVETWVKPIGWLEKQAEESFCDFLGLRLFGQSYLQAFAYLIAPSYDDKRSPLYPNLITRVKNLLLSAEIYGLDLPPGYNDLFSNFNESQLQVKERYELSLAEGALQGLIVQLIDIADVLIQEAGVTLPDEDRATRIQRRFRFGVPAHQVGCLADIINAGWTVYGSKTDVQAVIDDESLKELILKSIEILDINQILTEQKLIEAEEKPDEEVNQSPYNVVQEAAMSQPTLFDNEDGRSFDVKG